MVGAVKIEVRGLREIERALKDLGATAANRVARSALNRSASPVVRDAKARVPVDTGELKRSVTKRLRRQRRRSASGIRVGAVAGPATSSSSPQPRKISANWPD